MKKTALLLTLCALVACGRTSGKSSTVTVPCQKTWTKTAIQVKPGQKLTLTATGQLKGGGFTFGPEGTQDHPEWARYSLVPEWPHLALIGKVGEDGSPFLVGRSYSAQLVGGGELYLGVNDLDAENNDGSFTVTVTLE